MEKIVFPLKHKSTEIFKSIGSCSCLFVFVAFFLLPKFLLSQTVTQNLNSNWQFTEAGKTDWLPATVPGTVHTDLLANGKIPDPYIGTNETKVQWVETKSWEYKRIFDADDALMKSKHKDLIFDGLDTYAFIFLNDSLLLTTENMFCTYRIDVSKILKRKNNILRIIFRPASELIAKNKALSDIQNLPGGDRVFIRKAQYQFGWDFGPRLVTCGIWKPVRLEGWNDFQLRDVSIQTFAVKNDTAIMNVSFSYAGKLQKNAKFVISDGNTVLKVWNSLSNDQNIPVLTIRSTFIVPHPRLWWCNGLGKSNLYHFKVALQNGKSSDETIVTTGIRTVRLITVDEKTDSTFYFELNGHAVFIKGANWIPCDNFLPRVTTEKYYSLLKSAQHSNMNMLRVWGGGTYEDDKFYDICDSLGIMVWQDFMFACGMYPGDNHFLSEVSREANDNIVRLQNHPSLSLWCGNNEDMEGWENWDWQKDFKYTEKEKKEILANYNALFDISAFRSDVGKSAGVLGDQLEANEISVFDNYIPTSPTKGWGNPSAYKNGDVHYWGVWWGKEPFSAYDNHVGKFMTEYGFQGMPALSSFRLFDKDGNILLTDSTIYVHQKNENGFATIDEYMQNNYPVPTDFKDFKNSADFSDYIYVSQVMQRDAISKAIEAHRRAMSYCMGTLFWQYNDCWPGITWSSIDYYGQEKLSAYAIKDLYSPLMVSVTERNDSVFVYVVNDDSVSHKGILGFQWMNFSGWNVRTSIAQTNVNGESSNLIVSFPRKTILDTLAPEKGVMHVVFSYEGDRFVSTNHYFVKIKSLQLPKDPGLSADVSSVKNPNGTYTVTLRTISLVKNVCLSLDDAKFSDNGFDMMPNETREIEITSKLSPDEIKNRLKVQMMNSFVQ